MSDNERGLYDKYTVLDKEGKPVEDRVFVLNPYKDKYALTTLIIYSSICKKDHPKLSQDLTKWLREFDVIS